MSATLKNITNIRGNCPTYGFEAPSLDQVISAIQTSIKEHDHSFSIAANGTKIASTSFVGTHTVVSHATVPDRIVPLNLGDWRILSAGSGLGLPTTTSDPVISLASGAPNLTWTNGGKAGGTIHASAQIPDNYDQGVDKIAFHAMARSAAAPATIANISVKVDLVKPGVAIAEIAAATLIPLSTAMIMQDVSKALSYNTLSQQDILAITLKHGAGGTAANIEFFGGWLEYTGEQ